MDSPEIDVAHLHEMGLYSTLLGVGLYSADGGAGGGGAQRVYYVQRTQETEAFFLTLRELMEAKGGQTSSTSMGGGAKTLPWLLYLGMPDCGVNVVTPSCREACGEVAYIARMCSNSLADDVSCAVCMETIKPRENPSQLPCAHFMCVGCLKKLYPVDRVGLKCPVCQKLHGKWKLLEMRRAPGGVALAEVGSG